MDHEGTTRTERPDSVNGAQGFFTAQSLSAGDHTPVQPHIEAEHEPNLSEKPQSDGIAAAKAPPSPEPAPIAPDSPGPQPHGAGAGSPLLRRIAPDEALSITLQVALGKPANICAKIVRLQRLALTQSGFEIVRVQS